MGPRGTSWGAGGAWTSSGASASAGTSAPRKSSTLAPPATNGVAPAPGTRYSGYSSSAGSNTGSDSWGGIIYGK